MLGMDFLKNYRQDRRQFPMQPECWWPLFAPTRGLYSTALCAQHWEPLSQAKGQTAPTGNDHLEFPDGDLQPPHEEDLSEIDERTVGLALWTAVLSFHYSVTDKADKSNNSCAVVMCVSRKASLL